MCITFQMPLVSIHSLTIFEWNMHNSRLNLIKLSFFCSVYITVHVGFNVTCLYYSHALYAAHTCSQILFATSINSLLLEASHSYIWTCCFEREKGRDLIHSHDKSLYNTKKMKVKRQHLHAIKTAITQRLPTDWGQPVGVCVYKSILVA